jgi:hypothetical protein
VAKITMCEDAISRQHFPFVRIYNKDYDFSSALFAWMN